VSYEQRERCCAIPSHTLFQRKKSHAHIMVTQPGKNPSTCLSDCRTAPGLNAHMCITRATRTPKRNRNRDAPLTCRKNVIVKSAHSLHYRLQGYDTSIISTCSLQTEQVTQSTRHWLSGPHKQLKFWAVGLVRRVERRV
jgi:hypothetical protein